MRINTTPPAAEPVHEYSARDRAHIALDAACNKLGVLLEITNGPKITEPVVKTRTEPDHPSYFVPAKWDLADALARLPRCYEEWAAEQTPAEPASETFALNREQLYAAIPGAIDEAARATLGEQYNPQVAADIAANMVALLSQPKPQRPLTAAQRGTEWMAKWGCPGFCVQEHGQPEASEFHTTAPVETALKASEVDCSGYSQGTDNLPWMSAQTVVSNDQAQAYGRRTNVFLGYGVHLAEISPAEARRALDAMRAFTVRLAAVVDFAEQTAADDFAGDAEIARLDREADARRRAAIDEARGDGAR